MSGGKTPGQAAYEGYHASRARLLGHDSADWGKLSGPGKDDWEAAAQAASAYYEDVASELRAELIDVRVLVAEILDHYAPKGTTTTTAALSWNAHFRQRAGLDTAVAAPDYSGVLGRIAGTEKGNTP